MQGEGGGGTPFCQKASSWPAHPSMCHAPAYQRDPLLSGRPRSCALRAPADLPKATFQNGHVRGFSTGALGGSSSGHRCPLGPRSCDLSPQSVRMQLYSWDASVRDHGVVSIPRKNGGMSSMSSPILARDPFPQFGPQTPLLLVRLIQGQRGPHILVLLHALQGNKNSRAPALGHVCICMCARVCACVCFLGPGISHVCKCVHVCSVSWGCVCRFGNVCACACS